MASAKTRAADDLMAALEDWAATLGDFGVTNCAGSRYFPSRQMDRSIRAAHREGKLFERLTDWLPHYRGLRTSPNGEAYANRMRDIVEHGAKLWEEVVADTGQTWTPYITAGQRAILNQIAADVRAEIARGQRLRAQMMRQLSKS